MFLFDIIVYPILHLSFILHRQILLLRLHQCSQLVRGFHGSSPTNSPSLIYSLSFCYRQITEFHASVSTNSGCMSQHTSVVLLDPKRCNFISITIQYFYQCCVARFFLNILNHSFRGRCKLHEWCQGCIGRCSVLDRS